MLWPEASRRHFALTRPSAHSDLSPWVERYWTVRWELPPGVTYPSTILTHPSVHLSVEFGAGPRHGFAMPAALVHGVVSRMFTVELTGSGRVFGVKFRPGGFGAFTGRDVASLTDRVVPLAEVVGDEPAADLLADICAADDDEATRLMDAFLLARRAAPDERYAELLRIVAGMLADRELVTVEAVTECFGVSARTLQRLFRRYVGVGPKWVLQRFRLHDAQMLLESGEAPDLATLAADLGWSDQAHFTRDFQATVGTPPGRYASSAGMEAGASAG